MKVHAPSELRPHRARIAGLRQKEATPTLLRVQVAHANGIDYNSKERMHCITPCSHSAAIIIPHFGEIAKAVSGDPSLKAEVLKSAETVIEPESFGELERMTEITSDITAATSEIADVTAGLAGLSSEVQAAATELGIASATAAAAAAAGVDVSSVMPTLETMQSPDFDAEAHNRAMQEYDAQKASGN